MTSNSYLSSPCVRHVGDSWVFSCVLCISVINSKRSWRPWGVPRRVSSWVPGVIGGAGRWRPTGASSQCRWLWESGLGHSNECSLYVCIKQPIPLGGRLHASSWWSVGLLRSSSTISKFDVVNFLHVNEHDHQLSCRESVHVLHFYRDALQLSVQRLCVLYVNRDSRQLSVQRCGYTLPMNRDSLLLSVQTRG
jgi:hypothetical protein